MKRILFVTFLCLFPVAADAAADPSCPRKYGRHAQTKAQARTILEDWRLALKAITQRLEAGFASGLYMRTAVREAKERFRRGDWIFQELQRKHLSPSLLKGDSSDSDIYVELLGAMNRFDQSVPESHRIYAALPFHHPETGEKKWVRINRDPVPGPEWQNIDLSELPPAEYQKLIASGIMPISIEMTPHDLYGHHFPWLLSPQQMRLTRSYYQEFLNQTAHVRSYPRLKDAAFEFLSLPNLHGQARVRKLFDKSLNTPGPLSTNQIRAGYGTFAQESAKIDALVEKLDSLILRLGGAVGDEGFITRFPEKGNAGNQTARSSVADSATQAPSLSNYGSSPIVGFADDSLTNISRHTLFYIAHELKQIVGTLKSEIPLPPGIVKDSETFLPFQEKLRERALSRMALIEAAYTNAVKMKITPEKLIGYLINGSNKAQLNTYLESFLPAESPWHMLLEFKKQAGAALPDQN